MAGLGRKTFSDGEVLSAADVNGYLMDQSVMRFADSTARTAAIGTPTEGMVTYLDDTNSVEKYNGSAWVAIIETADDVITTQGDLIIGDASGDPVRLPVGSADQVLTSDGTTVSFQDAGGGGGREEISSVTASGNSVTFSSIPATFSDLIVYGDSLIHSVAEKEFRLIINGTLTSFTGMTEGAGPNSSGSGLTGTNAQLTGLAGYFYIQIFNYLENYPSILIHGYGPRFDNWVFFADVLKTTTPITSIEIEANDGVFNSGTLSLYGRA